MALFPGLCVVPWAAVGLGADLGEHPRLSLWGHRAGASGLCARELPGAPNNSQKLGEEQMQPDFPKGAGPTPTWSGAGAESGLWGVNLPRGLRSTLSEAVGGWGRGRVKKGGGGWGGWAGKTCRMG